jgi:ubiquitin-activating enzyme E1
MQTDSKMQTDVDDALYSRQLYVYGHEAQQKMQSTSVLIVGMQGLGAEISKNIILAGVRAVHILDDAKVQVGDLSAHFYLTQESIGQSRAAACVRQLAELNSYVNVRQETGSILDVLAQGSFDVVVLTEETISTQIQVNNYCHSRGIKFICGDVFGLVAGAFVDLGEQHIVTDTDGEQAKRGLIANVSSSGVVLCGDDIMHGLSDGDFVTFEEVTGMVELNESPPRPIKVVGPLEFSIEDCSNYTPYSGTKGYFVQVKQPKTISFKTLEATINAPTIEADFYGSGLTFHALSRAVSQFREANGGRYPAPNSASDANQVVTSVQDILAQMDAKAAVESALLTRLARISGAKLNPMTAFLGGILGQEVLKACSGKFMPLKQYYYFDSSTCLPSEEGDLAQYAPQQSRYDSQIAVFGDAFQSVLAQSRIFLIGAGAIGCELLKNFALMGVSCDAKGLVHVTDMDIIEKSNLSRQFLFRMSDVGSRKSEVAAQAALRINPAMNIDARCLRVGEGSEDTYNDQFWDSLTCVCTALDNVDARLYTDRRCLYFQKPMIDSGTLGTKANTQVILPFKTESYGASRDPPEEGIPICTLKHFPSKIEHTIQWARDMFEGIFTQNAIETNNYLSKSNYVAELKKQPQLELTNLQTILSCLVTDRPSDFAACVEWARLLFQKEFYNNIAQLLSVFPVDCKTNEGAMFWSGHKRAPQTVVFDINDPLHFNFIVAAANLRASNFGIQGSTDAKLVKSLVDTVSVPPFTPKSNLKIAANDAEAKEMASEVNSDHDVQVQTVIKQLPAASTVQDCGMNPAEFDKDNDENFHIDFVAACSNLRARCYRIAEETRHQTKFIAGKIIPAIATTTAMVTGLVCLEFFKILLDKKADDFRNSYVNLALPLFAFSEPLAPDSKTCTLKDRGEWKWTDWDRLDLDIGDATLGEFLEAFQSTYGLEVSMITIGTGLAYTDFMPKHQRQLPVKVSKIAADLDVINSSDTHIILECCVVDEEGEDVEIPYVRLKFR